MQQAKHSEGIRATRSETAGRASAAARSATWRLWGWPISIGLLSASGLISALTSDDWGDVWSWFALGLPVLVMAWFGLRRSSNS